MIQLFSYLFLSQLREAIELSGLVKIAERERVYGRAGAQIVPKWLTAMINLCADYETFCKVFTFTKHHFRS